MGWILLTIFFAIIFWIGVGMYLVGKKKETALAAQSDTNDTRYNRITNDDDFPMKGAGVAVAVLSLVLWLAISGLMSFKTVGQREVAIVYNFSGTIQGKKDAGVINIMPWQHIKKESIGIKHDEWIFDNSNAAVSIDQQRITSVISVNYQIDPEKVVDLYKRVGANWKSIIIDARVPQVFKETTATYTTPELTQKREQLRIDTKERLIKELTPYDIKVVDVFIRNLGFSDSYTESIERKQKQVQDALTAQAKVAQVTAEANQRVAEAQGEAKANIAKAQGDATANRLRQRSLTPGLIQLKAIETLNPKVQVIICPPQSVCIPNSGVVPQPGN